VVTAQTSADSAPFGPNSAQIDQLRRKIGSDGSICAASALI
jgi:hypothetical protein